MFRKFILFQKIFGRDLEEMGPTSKLTSACARLVRHAAESCENHRGNAYVCAMVSPRSLFLDFSAEGLEHKFRNFLTSFEIFLKVVMPDGASSLWHVESIRGCLGSGKFEYQKQSKNCDKYVL